MKKLVVLFLVALLSLTCACGKNAGDVSEAVTAAAATETEVTDTAAPATALIVTEVTDTAETNTAEPEATVAVSAVPTETVKTEASEPSDETGETGTVRPVAESTPVADEIPAQTNQPAEEPADNGADPKTTAMNFIGQSVSALHAAIGYPSYTDYAPSCLGDGEDGNLYYDGFVVYTYKEGESETISYVE